VTRPASDGAAVARQLQILPVTQPDRYAIAIGERFDQRGGGVHAAEYIEQGGLPSTLLEVKPTRDKG
jgi:hypothetical protein